MKSMEQPSSAMQGSCRQGRLIINADDWGINYETTERIRECAAQGTISSVSAMMFMSDSERAADVARDMGLDTGLHLNFTTPFTPRRAPLKLRECQQRISQYLRHRGAQVIFHPGLAGSFEYVVAAQRDEFARLYGEAPRRIDGHHHMHLCSNVLVGQLMPPNTIVRRNFSFNRGEKSWFNRVYRRSVDRILARRHRLTDFFFSIVPLEAHRLQRILALARQCAVEVETHPVNPQEYQFLTSVELIRLLDDVRIADSFTV